MTKSLQENSQELAGLVDHGSEAVARVEGRHRYPASGIAWAVDGIIVTAHHVLERDDSILVSFSEKENYPARLLGRDPTTDLAALRIDGHTLNPSPRASTGELKVGNLVMAIARPGTNARASLGLVNAAGGSWKTAAGGTIDRYIQTSVEMLPGFSGGPLLDMEGRLIGMNTSALQRDGSLVVPIETIERVIKSLVAHGRIRRAYLGITSQPVRLGEEAAQTQGQTSGLMIIGVEADGPAAKGGILQGDILLSASGTPTRRIEDLVAALTVDDPSAAIQVAVLRGGVLKDFSIHPGEKD